MARGGKTIAVSEHIRRYTLKNYPLANPEDIVVIHGDAAEILARMFSAGAVSPLDYEQLEVRARDFLACRPVVQESDAFSLEITMDKHLAVYESLM